MHPASRILIYVLAALVIPGLSFFLVAILMVAALFAIAGMGRHPLLLIWRTRWLLLVLALGYGFSVPGDPVVGFLGEWAPTWPGLALGAARALHLMVLLLWLDVLVLSLSGEQLLSGLHAMMKPLKRLGMDTGRVALRMALTLKAIERLEQGDGRKSGKDLKRGQDNLRSLFDPVPMEQVPEHVVLVHYPIRNRDVWIPLLLLAGFAALVWTGGWT